MKRLLIFVALSAYAVCGMAMTKGDTNYIDFYQREYNRIFKEYNASPQAIDNMVAMAEFYSAANNPMRNLALAITYQIRAEKDYVSIVNDNSKYKEVNRLIKKKITIASLRKQKQNIIASLYNYIDKEAILYHQCDEYIEAFMFDGNATAALRRYKATLAYRRCTEVNTVEAYVEYIQQYPKAKETTLAIANAQRYVIAEIDNADTEKKVDSALTIYVNDTIQRCADKKKGRIAYRKTVKINTVEAYKEYMSHHPSADEYVLALERIDDLLYDEFIKINTPQDYAAFAIKNTDSHLSEQAVDSIVAMILDNRSIDALDVYLKNFPLDHRYSDVFQTYYRWHITDGGAAPIEYFATQYPDYPFSYSLNTDLERSRKIDEMNLIRPFEEKNLREYTEFIKQTMSVGVAYVALQRTIQGMIKKQQWNDAVRRVQSQAICFEDANVENYNSLLALLKAPADKKVKITTTFAPKHEVKNVAVTTDGTTMYYTRQDIFGGSTRIATAKRVKNRWAEDGDIVLSNADNRGMVVYSLFDNDTKMLVGKGGDIAIAEQDTATGQWALTSVLPNPINSDAYDGDAVMLADESGMLLVSDRRGGLNLQPTRAYFHGDTALASDIYYVPRKQNYGWGDIVNLGPTINTIYSERAPVMSKDMKTLYFVSDGHGGLGYLDVYKATRLSSNSWTAWSAPQNIGKVVNSGFTELALALSNTEDCLYVITNRNGKYEMLEISLNNDADMFERNIALYCRNDVAFGTNRAMMDIVDLDAKLMKAQLSMSDTLRTLDIRLFAGKTYIVQSLLRGYYSPIRIINSDTPDNMEVILYDIAQLKAAKNKLPLVLVSYMAAHSDVLTDNSYYELNNLADFIKDNPDCMVEVISNVADDDAVQAFNLSQSRSHTIKKYLVSLGVDKNRVIASGYGNTGYQVADSTAYPAPTEIRIW